MKAGMTFVIKEVSRRMNCSQKDARELLDHFCDVIGENMAKGNTVSYKPLGIFFPRIVSRQKAISVKFRASTTMKKKVADLSG